MEPSALKKSYDNGWELLLKSGVKSIHEINKLKHTDLYTHSQLIIIGGNEKQETQVFLFSVQQTTDLAFILVESGGSCANKWGLGGE